ncbi:MAG TPA: SseB family protein [bacterium]|nr:SseB family protein [bacterium]
MNFFGLFKQRDGNAGLERIMAEMATHPDMKVRRVLYLELLKGTLLLPLPRELDPALGGQPLKELQLVTHPSEKGEVLWLAFTSRAALHQWRPQFPEAYVAIQGRQVFALAVQNKVDQIIINPAGPIGGRITRMELGMLAEGTLPIQGGEGVHTVLSRSNTNYRFEAPELGGKQGLVEYLKGHLASGKGIEEAFLVLLAIGDGSPHLLLAIRYPAAPMEGSVRPFLEAIGKGIGRFFEKDDYLDMLPLDGGHEWAEAIREKGVRIFP